MKTINVVQDFKHIKLASKKYVDEIISKIESSKVLENETEIELNIEECVTDYPSTPRFIDYFLYHLSEQQNGKKKLIIKLNGLGNKEVYILYILVLEGKFFDINNKIDNEDEIEQWRTIINQKLKDSNISLKIIFTPDNKEYDYGN
jgi:hypothetical protein